MLNINCIKISKTKQITEIYFFDYKLPVDKLFIIAHSQKRCVGNWSKILFIPCSKKMQNAN